MDRKVAALVEDLARGRTPPEAPGPEAFHALYGSTGLHESVRAALFLPFAAEDAPPPPPAVLRQLLRLAQSGYRNFTDLKQAAVIHDAMLALAEPLGELVPTLIEELRNPDPFVHGTAAFQLETITHYLGSAGPEDGSLGEALRGALADDCADVRSMAASSLANLREDPDACVSALAALLEDPSTEVRMTAASALGDFGVEARDAIPALAALLKSEELPLAVHAATALSMIGNPSAEVLDGLLHLVRRPEADARESGIRGLSSMPAPTREAVEALRTAAAKDPEEGIRKAATEALARLVQRHGSL
jgi:hypothetical protein